ncbi:MAG: threonine--tRNA ligase [Patescibacteria group bacterium]
MESQNNDLETKRHSLAHLLAAAVIKLYPEAKPTLGPAIEYGFYYDFDIPQTITEKDLQIIETEMKKILKTWSGFTKKTVSAEEAKSLYQDNPYKLELIQEIINKQEPITLYISGEGDNQFTDLCQGGHTNNIKEIPLNSFKLDRIAGAYWRGNEKNKMLTRIYGLAFNDKKELEEFLKQKEEAKKRDHRKLGQELDLFTFSDLVGAGLPLFTPKGTAIRQALQDKLLLISKRYGMQPVTIPHIAKKALYETSGHADKFSDELIKVVSHYDEFVMKPVNCPHHTQIYTSRPRSYRDLPLRYMESTMQYRDEKPGEIGGLTRVRSITCDDGHIFCMVNQIQNEVKQIAQIIKEFYTELGMYGNHWVSLSVRDPRKPEDYIGEEPDWIQAEQMLQNVSDELKLDAKIMEGEAAIYGPKLDYMFKDSLGRERQLATIQVDFAMPKRFKLEYVAEDGSLQTPVMIHRAILGSYERFLAILIEHFAGAFPVWLSPVQTKIIPISQDQEKFATEIYNQLKNKDIRVEIDLSKDTLGKKIRRAKQEKIPYLAVIGDKEVSSNKINIDSRDQGQLGTITLDEFLKLLV